MNVDLAFEWHDLIGLVGVALILGSYLGLQAGWLKADRLPYQLANIVGSLGILWSLFYAFNLSSFVIQIAWIAISVFGIARAYRARQAARANDPTSP